MPGPRSDCAPPIDDFIFTEYEAVPRFRTPTAYTIGSGLWSDPGIWSTRSVPGQDAIVHILSGHVVSIDLATAALRHVEIQPCGELKHKPDAFSLLNLITLVNYGGTYRIGKTGEPITSTAALRFRSRPLTDTEQYFNGYVAIDAEWTIEGTAKAEYVLLAANAAAGSTTLSLASPATGWGVGDRIFISGSYDSRFLSWSQGTEQRLVAAVSGDGLTVTLATPLSYNHNAVAGHHCLVGALTHNVSVFSERAQGVRGHVLLTGTEMIWSIKNCTFRDLGRTTIDPLDPVTNRIGRYAMHFHHCEASTGTRLLEGVSIFNLSANPPRVRWPVAVHDTQSATMRDCVVYNYHGAGYVIEDYDAHSNIFENCVACKIVGGGDPRDWGHGGSGFDIFGIRNTIRNSYAFNCDYTGVDNFSGLDVPMTQFENLKAVMCGQAHVPWEVPNMGLVKNVSSYGGAGIYNGYQNAFAVYDGMYAKTDLPTNDGFTSSPLLAQNSVGLHFGDYNCYSAIHKNGHYEGYLVGVNIPDRLGWYDVVNPLNPIAWDMDTFTLQDSYIKCTSGITWIMMFGGAGDPLKVVPRNIVVNNVTYGNATNRIVSLVYDDPTQGIHLLNPDVFTITKHNGVVGVNLKVFRNEQSPSYIPISIISSISGPVARPPAGLTNQQLYDNWKWRLKIDPIVDIIYWQFNTAPEPTADAWAGPWRRVCVGSELTPGGAVDGTPYGIVNAKVLVL